MKNLIYPIVFFFAFSFCLLTNKAKAHPGDTCSNAVNISASSITDSITGNYRRWYKFTDTTTTLQISIKQLPDSLGRIRSISLFSACGGVLIAQMGLDSANQDSISLRDSALTAGMTYYILIDDSSVSNYGAKYALRLIFFIAPPPCTPVNLYNVTDCGVNWLSASVPVHGRINNADPPPANLPAGAGPYSLNIACSPTLCNLKLLQAYIIFTVINADPNYTGSFKLQDPAGHTTTYTPTPAQTCELSGSATSWEYNNTDCMACPPPTYNYFVPWRTINNLHSIWDEYDNTITYYVPVNTTQICGNYSISGLPQYKIALANNPPPPDPNYNSLLPLNYMDCDGVTLLVVYQDPCANYQGTFSIDQAFLEYAGYIENILPAPPGGTPFTGFFIASDLENQTFDKWAQPTYSVVNTPYAPPTDFWNLQQQAGYVYGPPTITEQPNNTTGDDYDLVAAGFYYQTPPVSCNVLTVSATATPTLVCNGASTTLTASASGGLSPYIYNWMPGGNTTQTITVSPTSNTTYTVIVTDKNCCTATAIVNVIASFVKVTVSTTNTCSGSNNGTATANVLGNAPPFNYLWSPGGQTTATITGLSAGNYTVTVTDNNGCTATALAIIKIDNLSVTITGYPNTTIASLACIQLAAEWYCPTVAGGTGPYVYTWSVVGAPSSSYSTTGVPCPNGIEFGVMPWTNVAVGGTITVTVVDANGCTATATYTVFGCCDPPSAYYELDYYTLTSATPPPATGGATITWSGTAWVFTNFALGNSMGINGILDLQTSMVINCSDVEMGTGAQIIVEPGYSLTIFGSHLHSCGNMWQNIDVKPGATLNISNSLIEDANIAVLAENGSGISNYDLDNTIFNRNWIGVDDMPYSGTHPGVITGCTFSCDASAGTPSCGGPSFSVIPGQLSLITPMTNVRGAVGVYIDNVTSINVGGGTLATNKFVDIDNGIFSRGSNTFVANCDFKNMTITGTLNNINIPLAGVFGAGDPTGAYTLTVGTSAANACTFRDCQIGVWARDTIHAKIGGNDIGGFLATPPPNPIGIYLLNNFYTQLHAENNNIHDYQVGVEAFSNIASRNTTIQNNTIASNPVLWPVSIGVYIIEVIPNAAKYLVVTNTITAVSSGVVEGNLVNKPAVLYNDITITGVPVSFLPINEGILEENCGFAHIYNNTVSYPAMTNIATDGIRLDFGFRSDFVTCNTLNWTNQNMFINGNQVPVFIEKNNFNLMTPFAGNNVYGIYDNPPAGTVGVIGSPTYAIQNYWTPFCSAPPYVATSQVWAGGDAFYVNPASCVAENPAPLMDIIPFFAFVFNTGATYPSPAWNCFVPPPIHHTYSKREALSVVGDSLKYPYFVNTSQWLDKFSLYYYLNHIDTTNLIDSSMDIQNFFTNAKNSNIGAIDAINTLLGDSNGVSSFDISAAILLNNSMRNPDTAEATYQSVFNIMIPMYGSGNNVPQNQADIATLHSIAVLCPAEYGTAVFYARAALSEIDSVEYSNPCEDINNNSDNSHKPAKKTNQQLVEETQSLSALVYPNPANTLLNIEVQLQPTETVTICIYNNIGEQVRCTVISNNFTTIPVINLASGIYYFRIIDNDNNLIKADNFMILH